MNITGYSAFSFAYNLHRKESNSSRRLSTPKQHPPDRLGVEEWVNSCLFDNSQNATFISNLQAIQLNKKCLEVAKTIGCKVNSLLKCHTLMVFGVGTLRKPDNFKMLFYIVGCRKVSQYNEMVISVVQPFVSRQLQCLLLFLACDDEESPKATGSVQPVDR